MNSVKMLTDFENSFTCKILRKHYTYSNKKFHLTLNTLLHYLVESECSKLPPNSAPICISVYFYKSAHRLQVDSGQFVSVQTTSSHPSCYMYTFTNVTSRQLRHSVQVLDASLERRKRHWSADLYYHWRTQDFILGV